MLPSKFKRYTDESQPLVVDTEVAKKIGLNESIVIRQLHYWLQINEKTKKNIINEKVWCYNSIKEWKDGNFEFWSESTIRRAFESLEKHNLIETMSNPKNKWSKEKWYTINYFEYSRLFEDKTEKEAENPINSEVTKMNKSKLPKWTNRSYQNEQMNIVTENTTENTTESEPTSALDPSKTLNEIKAKNDPEQIKNVIQTTIPWLLDAHNILPIVKTLNETCQDIGEIQNYLSYLTNRSQKDKNLKSKITNTYALKNYLYDDYKNTKLSSEPTLADPENFDPDEILAIQMQNLAKQTN